LSNGVPLIANGIHSAVGALAVRGYDAHGFRKVTTAQLDAPSVSAEVCGGQVSRASCRATPISMSLNAVESQW
jgi:hypothetical protein